MATTAVQRAIGAVDDQLSPTSALAALIGFKGAIQELDDPHPAVIEFVRRAAVIGGDFIDALDYAGITN